MASGNPGQPSTAIWLADLDAADKALADLDHEFRLLPRADELRLSHSAGDSQRQSRRLTAHRALRLLMRHHFGAGWADVALQYGEHGKPTLPGLAGDFNLAHSGCYAIIGLTRDAAIGVDLEVVRDVRLSPERRAALIAAASDSGAAPPVAAEPSAPEPVATIAAWVRLEALAKARGHGIGRQLTEAGVTKSGARAMSSSLVMSSPAMNIAVHDLDLAILGDERQFWCAAVALPRQTLLPPVQTLPVALSSLRALLIHDQAAVTTLAEDG